MKHFKHALLMFCAGTTILAQTSQKCACFGSPSQHAKEQLATMTLREKIGQLFMVEAFSKKEAGDQKTIETLITQHHIGGIIFMSGTAEKQAQLARHYQNLSKIALLIGQDNEWGRVGTSRLPELLQFPNSMTLGAISDDSLLYELGVEFARRCRLLGVNLNFAPVVDVNNNPANPVIGDRSFGEDKKRIAQLGAAVMHGMQDGGIGACAKHFPGHGDTSTDSHLALPRIPHSKERISEVELYPFQHLFREGLFSVMTAHLSIPSLDDETMLPSSLSPKIVTNLLQKDLGFSGLVITDTLFFMKSITSSYTPAESTYAALKAGSDILLCCGPKSRPKQTLADITAAIDRIERAVVERDFLEKELDDHVLKILTAKKWLENAQIGIEQETLECAHQSQLSVVKAINSLQAHKLKRKLYENALTLVRNKGELIPLTTLEAQRVGYIQVGGDLESNFEEELARNVASWQKLHVDARPNKQDGCDAEELSNKSDVIIIGIFDIGRFAHNNWGISTQTIDLIARIEQTGKPVVIVLFGTPYALASCKSAQAVVLAYEDDPEAQRAAAKVIIGKNCAQGILPIKASTLSI